MEDYPRELNELRRIDLKSYEVSQVHGFCPEESPTTRLSVYYSAWENIADHLPGLLEQGTVRVEVDHLPILSTDDLRSKREWQRAYSVLGFIAHSYIWCGRTPAEWLPPAIAIPFIEISNRLGLPPTATYAALNLWNWAPKYVGADLTDPDQLRSLTTFTGAVDEEWFYLVSVALEMRGGKLILRMMRLLDAIQADDSESVAGYLFEAVQCVEELGTLLERMHEKCDPAFFFHRLRPLLAGSKGMTKAGLPNGVFYDEGKGSGRWCQYSGGSNGQSSLLQFLDIVLGVEHYASSQADQKKLSLTGSPFVTEMRNYMPSGHRRFLHDLAKVANVREYVQSLRATHIAVSAYNAAIQAYAGFRDIHLRIVARYIIAPAHNNTDRSGQVAGSVNLASASTAASVASNGLAGTGGTALMPFLKQTRDETLEAEISHTGAVHACP